MTACRSVKNSPSCLEHCFVRKEQTSSSSPLFTEHEGNTVPEEQLPLNSLSFHSLSVEDPIVWTHLYLKMYNICLPEQRRMSISDSDSQWLGAMGTWKSQAWVFGTWPQKGGGAAVTAGEVQVRPSGAPEERQRRPPAQARTGHLIAGPTTLTCWGSLLDWGLSPTRHWSPASH